MKFFQRTPKVPVSDAGKKLDIVFASASDLEQALDGTDEAFERYYFALYHCSAAETNPFNSYRHEIARSNPDKAVTVGQNFVLWGNAAFEVVSHYYSALAKEGEPEEFREYAEKRLKEITRVHLASQGLHVPIDLSEGQLSTDRELEFFACLALMNQQILRRPNSEA